LAGDTLRFAGHGSVGQNGEPVQYLWEFGDGRTSTFQNPGLVGFPTPGTNVITFDVIDSLGQHDPALATRIITVIPNTNSIPDLAVTQLNVPGNLAIGQEAQITYTVSNAGDGNLSGQSWKDALYLSRDAYLDVNDRLLVSAPVSNNVGVVDSYTNMLTVTIPTVEEGAYYLLLSVNDEWQFLERHRLNNEFAVATDLVIPRLTNAVPFAATFTGNGDEHYFRIDVSAGQNLLIQLNGLDNLGASEVYVRFGALPTRGTFDYRAATPGSADQQLLIPAAAPGTYYILVRGESVPGNGQFTLETIASRLNVTGVTPDRYGQGASATLAIAGAGFDATAVAELVATNGTTYGATGISADSFTQLTATFNLSSVPVGRYSLRVSSPFWGTNTLADAFEVLPAGEARLETSLIVPSQLGYHAVATIWVEYRNTGNAAMSAPLLVLSATQNGREGAFLTLQQVGLVEGFWTSADPAGFSHSVQILASGDTPGVLQPGDSVRVPVYYAGWKQNPTPPIWDFSYPPMNWNLGVLRADDTNAVNWASLKSSMKPATISAEAWEVIWAGFTNQVGATWGDYVRMLDDNAAYLGRLGQRVVDVGQLLAFEFLQADGLSPLRTLASAVDAAVEAPGLPLVFSRSFPASISQRFELGPLGRGWSHNWQYSLSVAPDGTVTVLGPSASRRSFQPDSRYSGSYFAQPGDHATLTPLGGGAFTLREPAGLLRAFRSDGKLDYVQDPNGNRITAGYSGNLLTSLTHSSGQRLTIGYGAGGRVANITDDLGRQTILSYDGSGEHLLSAQYYDGRTATYEYQSLLTSAATHALISVANSCCTRRYFTYDAQGHLAGTHLEGNAEAVTFTYDTAGKVTATDALGGASKFYFDHRGLLVKTEDALGSAVHLAFDDYFNLARLTDPAGRSYGYAYDGNGNLTQSTDPLGHASRFTYHAALNRLASVTDADGNITRYAYTGSGNLQSITYADGSREGWAYDPVGNATTWTNRRSHPISYTYNTNGQLTNKLFADGSRAVYAYDPRCNLTNATTLDSQLSTLESSQLLYDSADRLTNITSTGGKWLSLTYDTAGRRASSLDQLGHRLTYAYDAAGRLESMTNELGELVVLYSYDPSDRLALKTLGNGMVATYGYDAAGQLLTLTNRLADGTAISWFNYAYDTRGRRTAMATHYGAWTYDYDDLGQLTRAVLNSTDPQIPSQDLAYVLRTFLTSYFPPNCRRSVFAG
jgi:YD repeat-containing protein